MRDTDDAVIHALYCAAAGMESWSAALSRLHAAMSVSSTQLFVIDKTNGKMVMHENSPESPIEPMFDYVREYHRIDPHVEHAMKLPVAEVFSTQGLLAPEVYKTHPFFLEQWTGHRVRAILGAKAAEDTRHVAMIGVTRQLHLTAYTDDELHLMSRYVGHLAVAFRIGKFLQRVHSHAIVGLGLMQASGRPMVLLDAQCTVLATNEQANNLLARSDPFELREGSLRCRDRDNARILNEAVGRLGLSSPVVDDRLKRTALKLERIRGSPLLCSLWDLRPEYTMGFFGTYPSALLTVADDSSASSVDPVWLASMFDFTPAEVRIASALLRGEELAQIAASQHVSLETVRTQLKSIFAKTNTHRQAELVALLARTAGL